MAAAGMLILLVLVFWAAQSQTWAVTRIWAPLIRAAGDGTGKAVAFKAVLLSVLAYTGGLLLLAALPAGAYLLFGEPSARAAALVLGTAFAPVALMPIPDRERGYQDIRRDLVRAGATHGQARACAWTTGPLGFLGLLAVGGAVLYAFLA